MCDYNPVSWAAKQCPTSCGLTRIVTTCTWRRARQCACDGVFLLFAWLEGEGFTSRAAVRLVAGGYQDSLINRHNSAATRIALCLARVMGSEGNRLLVLDGHRCILHIGPVTQMQ